jgi:uncharacterized RDD family membrane protein YckC
LLLIWHLMPGVRQVASPVTGLDYSGVLRRFGALCIDAPLRFAIGLAVVFLPMRYLVLSEANRLGSTDAAYLWRSMPSGDKAIVTVLWLVAGVVAPWLYTAAQECSASRATLGKRLLGISVMDLGGRRISFGRASGRFFARLIPTFGLGYGLALFTSRHQALHDLVAKCVVVRGRGASEPS